MPEPLHFPTARGIDPGAMPWMRAVEQRFREQDQLIKQLLGDTKHSGRGQRSTARLTAATLQELAAQQDALATQQDALDTAQGTLEQQQADLEQQQSDLADAVARRVTADNKRDAASGFATAANDVELCRVTFTVPTGYTRALVIAIGNFSGSNLSGGNAFVRGYVDINGSAPPRIVTTVVNNTQGSVTPSYSRILTGLSSGDTYTAKLFGSTGLVFPSNTLNTASLDASVIYLP